MFERLCSLLLRLYPEGFRREYGRDAIQLMRDRAMHERGVFQRMRLLVDLVADLCSTSLQWQPAPPALARLDGVPSFHIIEQHGPKPHVMAIGFFTSALMFASFALLLRPMEFPNAPAQLGEGSGQGPEGFPSQDDSQAVAGNGAEQRHALIEAVAANLKQYYVDRAAGQQLADALLAYEKNGAYAKTATGPELVALLNAHIQDTGPAIGIPRGVFIADVVYTDFVLPDGPPPPMTEAMREQGRAAALRQNCYIHDAEVQPRNVGYIRLLGFPDGVACHETIEKTMASLNGAAALIIDLRTNGGGMGDSALQMAGYFFDQPTFLYDPRTGSPVPTHTASPVAGNQLVDKPVFVLTSSRTQSAAEYFVYNLKMLKRITIVGERTAGHQHSGAFRRIEDHFGMGIQESALPENPFPVKGWEVIGVEPDVMVPSAEALDAARRIAESKAPRH